LSLGFKTNFATNALKNEARMG